MLQLMGFFGTVIVPILFAVILLFPLYAVIDIVRSDFKNSIDKLVWVLIVLFIPFLGALIYFFLGNKNKA